MRHEMLGAEAILPGDLLVEINGQQVGQLVMVAAEPWVDTGDEGPYRRVPVWVLAPERLASGEPVENTWAIGDKEFLLIERHPAREDTDEQA